MLVAGRVRVGFVAGVAPGLASLKQSTPGRCQVGGGTRQGIGRSIAMGISIDGLGAGFVSWCFPGLTLAPTGEREAATAYGLISGTSASTLEVRVSSSLSLTR